MGVHKPVLLGRSLDLLPTGEGVYADLTLGRGGHSLELLRRNPGARLVCFDLDDEAIRESRGIFLEHGVLGRVTLVKSNYAGAAGILRSMGIDSLRGIIADLGVSSPQFDEPERGFSYRYDGPLDMRMDQTQALNAYDIVNGYEERKLADIIYRYGEERDSRRIARKIVERRPIKTTFELVEAVKAAKSPRELSKKGHPAKQTFQALRIAVNGELDSLEKMLGEMPGMLEVGGVMAVITFHSLEDRLVKDGFRKLSVALGSRFDPGPAEAPKYRLLTRKPILPTAEEEAGNPRAKSAKLRALERIAL